MEFEFHQKPLAELSVHANIETAFPAAEVISVVLAGTKVHTGLADVQEHRLVFSGFAQWNMSIVVLHISLPLYMGESDISFKKTFCLMNVRPQDLLSHEPNSFGLGAPSF